MIIGGMCTLSCLVPLVADFDFDEDADDGMGWTENRPKSKGILITVIYGSHTDGNTVATQTCD